MLCDAAGSGWVFMGHSPKQKKDRPNFCLRIFVSIIEENFFANVGNRDPFAERLAELSLYFPWELYELGPSYELPFF